MSDISLTEAQKMAADISQKIGHVIIALRQAKDELNAAWIKGNKLSDRDYVREELLKEKWRTIRKLQDENAKLKAESSNPQDGLTTEATEKKGGE